MHTKVWQRPLGMNGRRRGRLQPGCYRMSLGEIVVEYKKEKENSLPESQPSVASGLPGRECFWVLVPNTKGLEAGGEVGLMGF